MTLEQSQRLKMTVDILPLPPPPNHQTIGYPSGGLCAVSAWCSPPQG